MIYFLYGQDTYRSKEELRKMIEKNKESAQGLPAGKAGGQGWLDFVRIDANDRAYSPRGSAPLGGVDVFKELKQSTDNVSMFNSKKMVIIENVFDLNQENQEEILELLKKRKIENDKDTTIIFWAEEADGGLFKYLKSKAECKEYELLKGAELKKWIKDFIGPQGGLIDNLAVERLIEWIGGDLWRMSNELNKLFAYGKAIRLENVELLIKPEIDLNIFEMVDAIGYKNQAKALQLFNQQLKDGTDAYYLLSMIVYQIRNLIKVKTAKAIELLGLHPFVLRKTGQQAEKFTFEELKKIYYRLMTIDFESKLGKTDVKIALEKIITDL